MGQTWQDLVALIGDREFRIERVRLADKGIAVEGDFEPPPLARLPMDDQVFAAAFLASHGSLKKMEALFGISYPTVKNRLNRIAGMLDMAKVEIRRSAAPDRRREVLDLLDRGEISFEEAMEELE